MPIQRHATSLRRNSYDYRQLRGQISEGDVFVVSHLANLYMPVGRRIVAKLTGSARDHNKWGGAISRNAGTPPEIWFAGQGITSAERISTRPRREGRL